uniref:Putative secreted protein n=1 Tax=Anopheles marajoara TaxID=58244 RepID=A0A2M4CDP2_9DIPT
MFRGLAVVLNVLLGCVSYHHTLRSALLRSETYNHPSVLSLIGFVLASRLADSRSTITNAALTVYITELEATN